jgi:hypothetical protein
MQRRKGEGSTEVTPDAAIDDAVLLAVRSPGHDPMTHDIGMLDAQGGEFLQDGLQPLSMAWDGQGPIAYPFALTIDPQTPPAFANPFDGTGE